MQFLIRNQMYILTSLQTVCWVVALLTIFTKNLSGRRKRAMLIMEIHSALLLAAEVVFQTYNGDPSATGWWAVRVSKFALFFLTFVILYSFNMYVSSLFSDQKLSAPPVLHVAAVLGLAGAGLIIVSQFTDFSYVFDESNRYQRRTGRTIFYLITFAILVMQLLAISIGRKNISRRIRIPLLLFTLIPFAAAGIKFVTPELELVDMTIVTMVVVLFIFTIQDMNEQVEQAHRMEIEMHERYQRELEQTVNERTKELRAEKQRAESLLLNILPADVAKELSEHPGRTIAKSYPSATVLFTDIVGFTKMSSRMTAKNVVAMLNLLTSRFDERAKLMGIEKIKTIGDAYMAAVGLREHTDAAGAGKMVRFAKGLLEDVEAFNARYKTKIQIRVGINTGELVAGVIGKTKFIYDIWGDTVNVASRMESTGEPMRIHASESTHALTADAFAWGQSVEVTVKGKGLMKTYFL